MRRSAAPGGRVAGVGRDCGADTEAEYSAVAERARCRGRGVWRRDFARRQLKLFLMSYRIEHEATPSGRHAAGFFAPAAPHRTSDGHALLAPVLVLNASYEPINVCAARRALVLVLKGVAMTEEENGHFLHSARVAMRLPSVIRLLEYRRIPHQSRALSRKNILL